MTVTRKRKNLMPGIERSVVDGENVDTDGTLAIAKISIEDKRGAIQEGRYGVKWVTLVFTLVGKYRNRRIFVRCIIAGSSQALIEEKVQTRRLVDDVLEVNGLERGQPISSIIGLFAPIRIDIAPRYGDGQLVNVVHSILSFESERFEGLAKRIGPQMIECPVGPPRPIVPGWSCRPTSPIGVHMLKTLRSEEWKARVAAKTDEEAFTLEAPGKIVLEPLEASLRKARASSDEWAEICEGVEADASSMKTGIGDLEAMGKDAGIELAKNAGLDAASIKRLRRWYRIVIGAAKIAADRAERLKAKEEKRKEAPDARETAVARSEQWIEDNRQKIVENIQSTPLFRAEPVQGGQPIKSDPAPMTEERRREIAKRLTSAPQERLKPSVWDFETIRRRKIIEEAERGDRIAKRKARLEEEKKANLERLAKEAPYDLPRDHPDYCPF